jgi:hypothetical protein
MSLPDPPEDEKPKKKINPAFIQFIYDVANWVPEKPLADVDPDEKAEYQPEDKAEDQ